MRLFLSLVALLAAFLISQPAHAGPVVGLFNCEGCPVGLAVNFESDAGSAETVNVNALGLIPNAKSGSYEGTGTLEAWRSGVLVASDHSAEFVAVYNGPQLVTLTVRGVGLVPGTRADLTATGEPDFDGSGTFLRGNFTLGKGASARVQLNKK